MTTITITVTNKTAICQKRYLISANSNYRITFKFDDEWPFSGAKTARLVFGSDYYDLIFTGDTVELPKIPACETLAVGVFTDTLSTNLAELGCIISAADFDGTAVTEFTESQYDQIVALLNQTDLRQISGISRDADTLVISYRNGESDCVPLKDGIGIRNASVCENGELILTLTDGNEIDCGCVKGDKGDPGEKGEKGDAFTYSDFTAEQLASLKGEKGDKGDKGDPGEKGDTGETPELSVGTVETLAAGESAQVSLSGTAQKPILHFAIPKGEDGADGKDGETGVDVWDIVEQAARFVDYNTGVLSDELVRAGYLSVLQTAGYTNVRGQLDVYNPSGIKDFAPKDDAVFPKKVVFGLKADEYLGFSRSENYEKYEGITDVIFDYSDTNIRNITISNVDWTGLKGLKSTVRSIVYPKNIKAFYNGQCHTLPNLEKIVFYNVGSFMGNSFTNLPKLKKLHLPVGAGDWTASNAFNGVTLDELTVDEGFRSTIFVSSVINSDNANASSVCHAVIENLADLSGYTLTTEEPSDWSESYTNYYTETDGVYSPVTDDSAPDWAENTYYSANTSKPIYFGTALLSLIDDEHKQMLTDKNWTYA